ncbi:MAG TPA: hypothetical protein VFV36_08425 [Candidatus Methylomirabilis sp.]|nr:hypothetical protein [Candidatus Methylomirabilis sp.]
MKTVAALTLLLATAGAGLPGTDAGEPAQSLPHAVPDFTDAETLSRFTPVAQGRLWGDPDFPVLLIRGLAPPDPAFVLIVLDARNGKDTWSLVDDPMILVTVGQPDGAPATYVDEGFVTQGTPSGAYVAVEGATLSDLSGLLEGGYASAGSRETM